MTVVVATASQKDVPIELQVIGNVEAYSTITVKPQVSGQLTQVYFREGDYVRKGETLFTIDPRPLAAQVSQTTANLARDKAQLSLAEANLERDMAQEEYARAQAERYAALFQQGVVSKEQMEQARTSAKALAQTVSADRAAIESSRAQIAATTAALENANLQLGYTSILSPIDGRTGNLAVKQGNIVTANTTDLMTITQVQPIYITFSIPEAHLPAIKKYMARGALPVIVTPDYDGAKPLTGQLTFVDNMVDASTGTIRLKGVFANAERALWPGQFVRVVLRLTTQPDAVVVPNQAVQNGQEGQYVFVVTKDRTAEMRPVVTGARVDQDLVIEQGLQPGETVVTEGQLRLAPGSRVQVRDGRVSSGRKKPPA